MCINHKRCSKTCRVVPGSGTCVRPPTRPTSTGDTTGAPRWTSAPALSLAPWPAAYVRMVLPPVLVAVVAGFVGTLASARPSGSKLLVKKPSSKSKRALTLAVETFAASLAALSKSVASRSHRRSTLVGLLGATNSCLLIKLYKCARTSMMRSGHCRG